MFSSSITNPEICFFPPLSHTLTHTHLHTHTHTHTHTDTHTHTSAEKNHNVLLLLLLLTSSSSQRRRRRLRYSRSVRHQMLLIISSSSSSSWQDTVGSQRYGPRGELGPRRMSTCLQGGPFPCVVVLVRKRQYPQSANQSICAPIGGGDRD